MILGGCQNKTGRKEHQDNGCLFVWTTCDVCFFVFWDISRKELVRVLLHFFRGREDGLTFIDDLVGEKPSAKQANLWTVWGIAWLINPIYIIYIYICIGKGYEKISQKIERPDVCSYLFVSVFISCKGNLLPGANC